MSVESYVASLPIPGDSPSISGVYLEQIIPGYRTSQTTGRWNLYSTLNEYERPGDWSRVKSKRYSARDFVVEYYITCDTTQNLHNAVRKLKSFLHQKREEFKVIFHDDPNIFYTGIIDGIEAERLVNLCCISGRFKIHCADGRGYSVQEYEVDAQTIDGATVFQVDYNGTTEAYPFLEAYVKDETGFVGFLTEDGKIVQIGDPTSVKDVTISVINHNFKNNSTTNWIRNTYTPTTVGDRTFTPAGTTKAQGTGMTIDSSGTGENNHGPVFIYDTGEDSQNFELTLNYILGMESGKTNVAGGIDLIVLGHDDGSQTQYEIARISIYKKENKTSATRIDMIVDGNVVESVEFKMDDPNSNVYTGSSVKIG